VATPKWRIRLGDEAEKDFVRILERTRERFGERQVEIYKATLLDALAALEGGPNILGSAARDEILPGLRSLHVARHRHRGRHFVMYRAGADRVIEVVRILQDAMDLARHVPKQADDDAE
jgi:toxin ParE1/3/4